MSLSAIWWRNQCPGKKSKFASTMTISKAKIQWDTSNSRLQTSSKSALGTIWNQVVPEAPNGVYYDRVKISSRTKARGFHSQPLCLASRRSAMKTRLPPRSKGAISLCLSAKNVPICETSAASTFAPSCDKRCPRHLQSCTGSRSWPLGSSTLKD